MEAQRADARRFEPGQGRAVWARLLAIAAGVLILHQLLMASQAKLPVAVAPVAAPPVKSALPCERTMPPVSIRACVNAEQLRFPPGFTPLLLALAAFVVLAPVARARPPSLPAWRWPARQQRALLQIFLI